MLVFTQEQVDWLGQATFFRNLEARIEAIEGEPVELTAEQRGALWEAAKGAARFGIRSIGACLVLCHVFFELGLDFTQEIPAFAEVLADERATEDEKVQALWSIRTALFAALRQG